MAVKRNSPRTKPPAQSATPPERKAAQQRSIVLVLQGGGALGAYQAGVYEGLAASDYTPDWIAGVSIGAINAALIAGNPPERRVERLRAFWERVSSGMLLPAPPDLPWRTGFNWFSAQLSTANGINGFYQPRSFLDFMAPPGKPSALGLYDSRPLRDTLLELIDFDLINRQPLRLSVGAVDVRTGNSVYFDNSTHTIGPEHIMASGALPPAFAPVEIDGAAYWDGGIVSNTPLQYVLDQPGSRPRTGFQVDLFAAAGAMPANLDEVVEREKDIRFSSRTRLGTTMELDWQVIALAAQRLAAKLPASLQDDPDLQKLANLGCHAAVDVVHLIYRSKHYESQSKDYEFSRLSMQEHWASGQADMAHTLHDPRWLQRQPSATGVRVFDLTADVRLPVKTQD